MSVHNDYQNFYIDDYLSSRENSVKPIVTNINNIKSKGQRFNILCEDIKEFFQKEWDYGKDQNYEELLERQKRAIIGHPTEIAFFKDKIADYLRVNDVTKEWFPEYYQNLEDAIFQENWGTAGLSEWFSGRNGLEFSSSAKIIGENIFFLVNGKPLLMPQKISYERRKQLRKALLLKTPKKRIGDDYHELYTLDGTRITIYGEGKTKAKQDSFVFRKFIVKDYSFERQAELGMIPKESVDLFKAMSKVGFNVSFVGAVRTAKTTFLTTWQINENPELEGIFIETDPEVPINSLMPNSPIIQLVADGEELKGIIKTLLRSDADYIVMAEARDATAFYIALEITSRGTRRTKMTAHFSDAIDFPYDMSQKIIEEYPGDVYNTTLKVFKNFNFVFEFIQLKDKNKKRLKGIYELQYDPLTHNVCINQICKYYFETDSWCWNNPSSLGINTMKIGKEEDEEIFNLFTENLKKLSLANPIKGNCVFIPSYIKKR